MKNRKGLLYSVLFYFTLTASLTYGQGNLLVTPVRVIFDDLKQKEDLNISNLGQDSAVYIISFVHYKMQEDGSFQVLAKGDSISSAEKYLRIFPRRIKLAPNESQTIRLQCRRPADMASNEYRTHLYFRADKQAVPLGLEDKKRDSTKMAVRITAIFGISIPVFVRKGSLTNQNTLSDVTHLMLNDSTSTLTFNINRSGTRSSYGNLKVQFISDKGQKTVLGVANGVGVYTEIDRRLIKMTLRWPELTRKKQGKLLINFTSPDEDGANVLASTEYIFK